MSEMTPKQNFVTNTLQKPIDICQFCSAMMCLITKFIQRVYANTELHRTDKNLMNRSSKCLLNEVFNDIKVSPI